MDTAPSPQDETPQLRTLLLTDLCDSTSLVEALGDARAAAFFREHDRLVLELQQRWRGRLIDRSDGMLLLFERPLDGLGFALDYRRELEALGRAHAGRLVRARSGLHVGELLIWSNSQAAVQAGAKQMEVEGLAKPLAARLMQLARPGQILLSPVAEPLLRRAAGELGERGLRLQWRDHGRWRLRGLPEAQNIFEVGEPGMAPLRTPRGDAKARRELPLWRRPAAFAAAAVLALGLGSAVWFSTRSNPAVAFAERDWVVMADLENLTGVKAFDDSLQQAFRLSLEQSRHVNVISELKARQTLVRMRRPADARLDRQVALEIAQREGAWGAVLPAVAEVGGRIQLSLRLVDARTQSALFSTVAMARDEASILAAVDQVTGELRAFLGEDGQARARDSKPLPQVATRSLDALRAYARAQEEYNQARYAQARDFYLHATQLDPEFALAYIGLVRAYNAMDQFEAGAHYLEAAMRLREHLPARDQAYLDAWRVQLDDPARAAEAWFVMSELYPDYMPAAINAAFALEAQGEYARALELAPELATTRSELAAIAHEVLGRIELAAGRNGDAQRHLAMAAQSRPGGAVWLAALHAVRGDFGEAERNWPADTQAMVARFEKAAFLLDQGRLAEAADELERQRERLGPEMPRSRQVRVAQAVVAWARGETGAALGQLQEAVEQALAAMARAPREAARRDEAVTALYAALLAQRMGQPALARQVSAQVRARPALAAMRPVDVLLDLVQARHALLANQPEKAIALLQPLLDGNEPYQARVAMLEARLMAGQDQEAMAQAQWLAGRRGLAYAEFGCAWCQQLANVVDAGRASRLLAGDTALLQQMRQRQAGSLALAPAAVSARPSSPRRE